MSKDEAKKTPTLEEIMLQRELREQAEYEERREAQRAEKENFAARKNARIQSDKSVVDKELRTQARCNHEKWSNAHKKPPQPEYNIYAHQLPDGTFFIKCRNRCGMRWNQGDTREFLIRDGKKIPNHTGQSFQDMWAKLPADSVSRSDVVMPSVGSEAPTAA